MGTVRSRGLNVDADISRLYSDTFADACTLGYQGVRLPLY